MSPAYVSVVTDQGDCRYATARSLLRVTNTGLDR
jgi:hypothetical protein